MTTRRDTLALLTTLDAYHDVAALLERRGSAVKINKTLLDNLLRDHSTMVRRLNDLGIST